MGSRSCLTAAGQLEMQSNVSVWWGRAKNEQSDGEMDGVQRGEVQVMMSSLCVECTDGKGRVRCGPANRAAPSHPPAALPWRTCLWRATGLPWRSLQLLQTMGHSRGTDRWRTCTIHTVASLEPAAS